MIISPLIKGFCAVTGLRRIRPIPPPEVDIGDAFSWSSYWAARSLVYLDGTISGDVFVDKSVNSRNFTITGKDFADDWEQGFPYKSEATISAPVGDAILIAADINNFLYDAGGTPNQIPVVSLFQNIDYANRIFCKHVNQVVDEDNIEISEPYVSQIIITKELLTGDSLEKANTYFDVPIEDLTAKWIDPVNGDDLDDGSKLSPWKTLPQSTTGANDEDTVYIKTGECDLDVLWDSRAKTLHCKCIGLNNTINSGIARTYMIYGNPGTFNGFNFDGTGITDSIINVLVTGATEINNCRFDNYYHAIRGAANNTITMKHCIGVTEVADARFAYRFQDDAVIDTCYSASDNLDIIDIYSDIDTIEIKNSKLNSTSATIYATIGIYKINNIIYKGNVSSPWIVTTQDYDSAEILSNIITIGGALIVLTLGTPALGDITIKNNIINDTGVATKISILNKNLICQNNIVNHNAALGNILTHVSTGIALTTDISGNTFNTLNDGAPIQIGDDTFVVKDKITGSIYNNKILGNGYYGDVGMIHGIRIWANKGVSIHHNYINGWYIAIVLKGGNCDYATNPVYSNTIVDGHITCKGVSNTPIYGNTFLRREPTVVIVMNEDELANQALNTQIKNNIIICNVPTNVESLYQLLDFSTAVIDYNILYNVTDKIGYNGAYKNITEWRAMGYDVNSIVLTDEQLAALFTDIDNLDLSLAAGSLAIGAGIDIGIDYDDGLDESTEWNEDDELPDIVTKQQTGSWDVGAYIS